jgi:hypothetical protein
MTYLLQHHITDEPFPLYPSLLSHNNGYKTIAKKNILKNQERRREQGDLFIVKIIINIRIQEWESRKNEDERREKNQWHNAEDEGCGKEKKRFKRHFGADFYRTQGEENKSKFFFSISHRKSRKLEKFFRVEKVFEVEIFLREF